MCREYKLKNKRNVNWRRCVAKYKSGGCFVARVRRRWREVKSKPRSFGQVWHGVETGKVAGAPWANDGRLRTM